MSFKRIWNEEATRAVLVLWGKEKQNSRKANFESIAKAMQEMGHDVTRDQCRKKVHLLFYNYKKTVKEAQEKGKQPRLRYFRELEDNLHLYDLQSTSTSQGGSDADPPDLDESEDLEQQHNPLIYPTTYHVAIPADSLQEDGIPYQLSTGEITGELTPVDINHAHITTAQPAQQYHLIPSTSREVSHSEPSPSEIPSTRVISSTPAIVTSRTRMQQDTQAHSSSSKKSLDSSEVLELMARLQADSENREDIRQQRLLEHEARMEERRLQWEERRREKEEAWHREQREWDRQRKERDSNERREREEERRREVEFSWESKRREREMQWEGQRREKELQWEEKKRERELQQQQKMLEAMLQTVEQLFQHATPVNAASNESVSRAEESAPALPQQQQAPGIADYAKIMNNPETLPFDQPLS